MFVSDGRTLIDHAFTHGYIVPAFNVCSAEMVRACLEAAADLRAPVILQTYPSDIEQLAPKQTVALVKSYAEELNVPVMLHLDHGPNFELALACLRAGYSSVMYDGAGKPLESVVRETKRLAKVAHLQGAAVEVAAESFDSGTVALTKPQNAVNLFEAGADMVAVSVGSEHGQAGRLEPSRLSDIAALTQKPLVLHGGSGVSAEDFAAARRKGVVKANIGSALYRVLRRVWETSAEAANHRQVYALARAALYEVAEEKLRWCGAANQAESFSAFKVSSLADVASSSASLEKAVPAEVEENRL